MKTKTKKSKSFFRNQTVNEAPNYGLFKVPRFVSREIFLTVVRSSVRRHGSMTSHSTHGRAESQLLNERSNPVTTFWWKTERKKENCVSLKLCLFGLLLIYQLTNQTKLKLFFD